MEQKLFEEEAIKYVDKRHRPASVKGTRVFKIFMTVSIVLSLVLSGIKNI
jgi:hypothetical protein